jgi:IS4 transposase
LIVVQLDQLTREKESEMRIVSDLSKEQASAVQIAAIYRLRWTLEGTFGELTQSMQCELKSLGYPKAALLTFTLAVCAVNAVNALRVVTRALEESRGKDHPEEEVSSYYVVNEMILVNEGMDVVVVEQAWRSSAPGVRGKWRNGCWR